MTVENVIPHPNLPPYEGEGTLSRDLCHDLFVHLVEDLVHDSKQVIDFASGLDVPVYSADDAVTHFQRRNGNAQFLGFGNRVAQRFIDL